MKNRCSHILLLLVLIGGLIDTAHAQPASINGSYDPAFGSALSVQTDATGFGANYSELDAAYGCVTNGVLYLFISGNLQNNGNNINLFIGGANGQSTLNAVNPGNLALNNLSVMNGSTFSPGFSAVYAVNVNNTNKTLTVSQYNLTNNTAVDTLGSLTETGNIVSNATIDNSVIVGFNNNNTKSQAANIGTGATGLEFAIPLTLIGTPTGSIKVMVTLNGYQEGYLSNQLLPGLASGTGNLGTSTFSFSATAGEYFTVPAATAAPVLSVNGTNADYGMTHVFVNELSNDAVPLTIIFSPNASTNIVEADVFSNLNRRDHAALDANGDGIDDGILPPDGNTIATGDTNNYYEAYAMTPTGTAGQYSLTLYAQKTGVYRLTARWKVAGSTNWNWYSTNAPNTTGNRRDFSVVVSPKKAREAVIYEANVGIVGAQGTSSSQRSTFTDLYNGPGSRPYDPITNRFNLSYLTNLGANWLWLQPIHPIGVLNSVNSPYCVKNFFQVSPLMSKTNTRAAAMQEFQGFVAAADAAGVNVMMDVPFNHTAHDVELDTEGVADFGGQGNPGNWQPSDLIPNRVPQFFSATNAWCSRATSTNNIAIAPDIDISKWTDVNDIFFGDYAALVCANPQSDNNANSADDWFDYSTSTGNFDNVTQNVWRYYANSILYWLNQTGCTNGTPASGTAVGIDGIRADFADGLPPQTWEYIINKVRSQKWDFVFLAESLSWPPPSATTYRSGRDFDILCDSVYSAFQTSVSATNYQSIFNSERSSYGGSLMLWNSTSHDAGGYYTDPYQALVRFMVGGTIEGAPMVFYGQELGTTESFGFSVYGGDVPNFFGFNSLQPAITAAVGNVRVDQLYPLFSSVGQARQASPALKSGNRVFLTASAVQTNIYGVAKFVTTNGAPNFNDVEFAFVNLDVTNGHAATFNVTATVNGTNLFGITPGRMYNVKNIAAYVGADPNRRNVWLWGTNGVAGSNLLANGVSVSFNAVPTNAAGWTNAPYEAQYLKLYDVTPPAMLAAPTTTGSYVISNSATFSWVTQVDSQGGIAGYLVTVGTNPGGSNIFYGVVQGTSLAVTNAYGTTLYAEVSAVNNAGIAGTSSASSTGVTLVDPSWIPVLSMKGNNVLQWNSVSNKTYQMLSTTNLGIPFTAIGGVITATGAVTQRTNNFSDPVRFYRVQLFP